MYLKTDVTQKQKDCMHIAIALVACAFTLERGATYLVPVAAATMRASAVHSSIYMQQQTTRATK